MPNLLPPTYPSLPAARPPAFPAGSTRLTPGGRETWRGSDILRNCAASAELADAIVGGPSAIEWYVLGLVRGVEGRPEVRAELAAIYERLGRGTATYGDLSRLQELA